MDCISSHTHLDFDGLAAAVAARILYPGSIISFPGRMNPDVRDFTSLYKDHLQLTSYSELDKSQIQRLILVDCRPHKRLDILSHIQEETPIIVYDHHLEEADAQVERKYQAHIAPVGATTTLLLEKIMAHHYPLTPFWATLFLLGIYSDTGSLRYPTTTPRDTQVVTHLLSEGASLEVVDEFLRRPLEPEQQQLLNRLLEGGERLEISGITVQIFTTSCNGYVPGLNRIIHELKNLTDAQVVITLVAFERGVSILGRSRGEYVDLSHLFEKFGGGGHKGAAAAFVKNGQIMKVRKALFHTLQEVIKPPITAAQIMSHPVHAIKPEQKMVEAEGLMLLYGHSGLVVMEDGKIEGILSRRDIDKGRRHQLEHAPVKAFMSASVVTVPGEAPLHDIQKIMMENDIGRVPVKDSTGKVVGIVTRSDILQNLYGHGFPREHRSLYGSTRIPGRISFHQFQKSLEALPATTQKLLQELGRLAQTLDSQVYLVGGFVRDLFLGYPSMDLDLVIEGDSREYAHLLEKELGGERVKESPLGTVELKIGSDYHLDVAISRLEYYEKSGSLPRVQFATLEEDLFRRDFTINALALSLHPQEWGVVMDFFNGLLDLKEGTIRVLHNFSFADDPLRILRGLRFAGRYGFTLEEHTRYLITASMEHQVLDRVSAPRLTQELVLVFSEKNIQCILQRMEQLKVIPSLFPGLKPGGEEALQGLDETFKEFFTFCPKHPIKPWLVRLMLFFSQAQEDELLKILRSYSFSKGEEAVLTAIPNLKSITQALKKEEEGSGIFQLLKDLQPEELIFLYHTTTGRVLDRVRHFLQTLCTIRPALTGKDLLKMGFQPGPEMGRLLWKLKKGRLDGAFQTRQEELDFLMQHYLKQIENREGV